MTTRLLLALGVAAALAGAFFIGRGTAHRHAAATPRGGYAAGYRAGREDAFSGFDGGWRFGAPYVVILTKGPPGITYRFARRVPMAAGVEYRACAGGVCSRRQP